MKLVIAAGGGGHFSPALALINELPKDWEVLVIGRKHTFEGDSSLSLEYQTVQRLHIPFKPLTTGRLQRKLTRHSVQSLFKIPLGFYQALSILRKEKPDIVVSFGGYIAVPVVMAAYVLRIPIVIHEQTLGAGLANKVSARFANKICLSWKQSEKFFPKEKSVLTGNPLRKEFINSAKEQLSVKKSLPVIYITGGSSGSHAFNELIEGCLSNLLEKYIVIHQTGDAREFHDYDRLQTLKETLPLDIRKRYVPMKFIEPNKVVDFLNQADLVVSRSGISTVTELLYLGKVSLLIPLPFGQRNEQLENALFMKETRIAEIADQRVLTPDSFYTLVTAMMKNLGEYRAHADNARKLVAVNATEKIMEVISDVAKQKSVAKTQ